MGWLSSKPGPDTWEDISAFLKKGLADDRERFFQAALGAVRRSEQTLVNQSLGGAAERALIGHQLGAVLAYIRQEKYIGEKDGPDFSALLYDRICGDKVNECLSYQDRYCVEDGDGSRKMISDVIRYITDLKDVDLASAMGLMTSELVLSSAVQIHVALSFGDEARANQLIECTRTAMEAMEKA